MKKTKVKIPIYDQTLVIIKTKKLKELPDKYELGDLRGYSAVTFYHKGKYHIAFSKDINNGIIAHEALHFVGDLFNHVGIKHDAFNDEPFAYMLGWAVNKITKILNK